MQQLTDLWHMLSPRKRVIVGLATLFMFAAVYGLSALATRPTMALLYSGIDGSAAGEVLRALDQKGAAYEVRGDAIYVSAATRDQLRMELAAQGLPANSGTGYELLDSLSGFGTTAQMFDAAYWRAKEGELARTITALPNVRSVRVHISNTEPQGFGDPQTPTASVTVVTRDGSLAAPQARALRFLIASAVAGMKPDDVAVIDGQGVLIPVDDAAGSGAGDDRAARLKDNVTHILEARVGPGKAIVEVAVDTITDRESISERKIDPQSRVAISSENEEQTSSSSDKGGAAVTVASNLPAQSGTQGDKSTQANDSQTRERINYEVSETKRDLVRDPGGIRRITVAVLVDGVQSADANGQSQWQPRAPDELAALQDLVAAAVGFDKDRGDVITIKSLPFEPAGETGTTAGTSFLSQMQFDLMGLVQLAVLSLVALSLGLFVLRPILTARNAAPRAMLTPPVPPGAVLTGDVDDGQSRPGGALLAQTMPARGLGAPAANEAEVDEPVARLKRLIAERQDETVEILKSWMTDSNPESA